MCYLWIIEDFALYITQSFGIPLRVEAFQQSAQLPLYLKGNFIFFKGEIAGKTLVWAKIRDDESVTPDRLQKQKNELEKGFHLPVVFVFERLDSWQRKRLIERQVAFVQTGRQVYIPELFLQLDDTRGNYMRGRKNLEVLSYPAQVTILYHLGRSSLNGRSASQIAKLLRYSKMTVTRVIRELEEMELIDVRAGKERVFEFKKVGKALWQQAEPLLRNPIKEMWFSQSFSGMGRILESGETALAHLSMLGESRMRQFAIGKEQFRSLRILGRLPELNTRQGNFQIEVWEYDPTLLVEDGDLDVDGLSLNLCLRGVLDPRVTSSLEEAMKNRVW
jgi:DNA-binding MarR family transcriptional regulator